MKAKKMSVKEMKDDKKMVAMKKQYMGKKK
jgi:hypothetical protein